MEEELFECVDNNHYNSLIKYLYNFDPIAKRFQLGLSDYFNKVRDKLEEFSFSESYSNLTKNKYSYILDNLQLVYGDDVVSEKDIKVFHLTEKNIIHKFLGIQNLDKLFDEDYFNFEWDMHAQRNFREHNQGYYRDHFIHQIRNMYMCDKLLDSFSFFDSTVAVLSDKYASKISEFACKKHIQFICDSNSPISELLKSISYDVYDDIDSKGGIIPETSEVLSVIGSLINEAGNRNILTDVQVAASLKQLKVFIGSGQYSKGDDWKKIISSLKNSPGLNPIFKEQIVDLFVECYFFKKFASGYFWNYVIYASIYLSCLFHDLSYPVCYFLEFRHRLSDYSSATYMFTHNSTDSYDSLENKLSNSLLFTLVSSDEMKRRLTIHEKKKKYDHGVYSAIAFLLHFYESGLINELSYEKQCAIELAAVAMYNHTLSFDSVKHDDYNEHYMPYFNQNPIAFLLRVCDDLQEWDRRYFEITDSSDLMFCDKCHTPLLKIKSINNSQSVASYNYKCFCNSINNNLITPNNGAYFLKRKIFVIRVSDGLTMSDDICDSVTQYNVKNDRLLKITVKYDYYKMLLMSRFSYARMRLKDLNELKLRIKDQNYRQQTRNESAPSAIFIDYFLTPNPITIKVKLVEKWLYKSFLINNHPDLLKNEIKIYDIYNLFFEYIMHLHKNDVIDLAQNILNPNDIDRFIDSIWWYVEVLKRSIFIKCAPNRRDAIITYLPSTTDDLVRLLPPYGFTDQSYLEYTKLLVYDCIYQYSKEMVDTDSYNDIIDYMQSEDYTSIYDNTYEYSRKIDLYISRYCHQSSTIDSNNVYSIRPKFNSYFQDNIHVNYFSDLYVFEQMNNFINN